MRVFGCAGRDLSGRDHAGDRVQCFGADLWVFGVISYLHFRRIWPSLHRHGGIALAGERKGPCLYRTTDRRCAETVQAPLSRAVSAICIVICVMLVWYTWGATAKAYQYGDAEMRSLDMPKFLLLGAMPICFALMAVQFGRFVFGRETLHSGEAGVHE